MEKVTKILVVVSGNSDTLSPFVQDQINALKDRGIEISVFYIRGKGILGYVKNYNALSTRIKEIKPAVVHAHFGLSGLLSVMQRKVPVVTTFHGCDVNVKKTRYLSKIANKLGARSIFVSKDLAQKMNIKDPIVIPCGIDLDVFKPFENKEQLKKKFNLKMDKKYILFASSFSNPVKNYPLAKEAVALLNDENLELLELKGYNREEVAMLLSGVDAFLLTSFREGSPQAIKEAMACNCPIVSTNVGDVEDVMRNTKGCYIGKEDAYDLSLKIKEALNFGERTKGRNDIKHFDNRIIADNIINVYNSIKK